MGGRDKAGLEDIDSESKLFRRRSSGVCAETNTSSNGLTADDEGFGVSGSDAELDDFRRSRLPGDFLPPFFAGGKGDSALTDTGEVDRDLDLDLLRRLGDKDLELLRDFDREIDLVLSGLLDLLLERRLGFLSLDKGDRELDLK